VDAATAVLLIDSLSKAKSYVDAKLDLDRCPTCLRPIPRDDLVAIIDGQLGQLTELKELNDQRNAATAALATAVSNAKEAEGALRKAVVELQAIATSTDVAEVVALRIPWPDSSGNPSSADILADIAGKFEQVKAVLETHKDSLQRDVHTFNAVGEIHEAIARMSKEVAHLERVGAGLERAHEIVHTNRVSFVQTILDSISQESNRLYQSIHPGEDIGLERLSMEPNRRGSVVQTGTFHGHAGIPPQALFSESHLDTLGFCVWLALAKREGSGQTVLLIDDVFNSVDSQHLDRIIDLLTLEGPNFLQVVIATHYRLWWDRCKNAQGVERIHLGEWTITNGIAAKGMPLATRSLRDAVQSPHLDRQAVSSKAGILLEDVLDGLALLYER